MKRKGIVFIKSRKFIEVLAPKSALWNLTEQRISKTDNEYKIYNRKMPMIYLLQMKGL